MGRINIAAQPGAFRANRRIHLVNVEFARSDGELATLEGQVLYHAGDALLTGLQGESWPVARDRFLATYEPLAPTQAGGDGRYCRRPGTVWAWRTDRSIELALSDGRGTLHASPGDIVVQFDSGDLAVMPEDIFEHGYSRLPDAVAETPGSAGD